MVEEDKSLFDFPFGLRPFEMSYLTFFLFCIFVCIVVWSVGFLFVWPKNAVRQTLRELGVAFKRVGRTVRELERKTLHLASMLIPFNYHLLLTFVSGFTKWHGVVFMTILTILWVTLDLLRINIPAIGRNFPLTSLAREHELYHLSGVTYFVLGCFISVVFFPPKIAITSITYMVLGDMSAAIIGITFGKIKIGKKSLEGTLAMFTVCFFIGINIFWNIHMREYPVILASAIASLAELFEPFGINDNLTIPLLSSLALQFGFHRIATCQRNWELMNLLDSSVVNNLVNDHLS